MSQLSKQVSKIAQKCFEQILNKKSFNQKDIKAIIQKQFPIQRPPLQQLQVQIESIKQGTYAQQFVPSVDLMNTFQSTYTKTLQDKKPSAIINSKLQKLYGNTSQIMTNTAAPNFHSQGKNWFLIQNRQQTLINAINNKDIKIEATIPILEESLQYGQMQNLQNKNVNIENTLSFKQWKLLRKTLQHTINIFKS